MRPFTLTLGFLLTGFVYSTPLDSSDISLTARQEMIVPGLDLIKRGKHHKQQRYRGRTSKAKHSGSIGTDSTSTTTRTAFMTVTVEVPLPSDQGTGTSVLVKASSTASSLPVTLKAIDSGNNPGRSLVSKIILPSSSGRRRGELSSTIVPQPSKNPVRPTTKASTGASSVPSAPAQPLNNNGLWKPNVGETFQIVLSDLVDVTGPVGPSSVKIFDIDLFGTPATTITALKSQGKNVVCYFSAGSSESWRPDINQLTSSDQGKGLAKDSSGTSFWPGEKWLNTKSANVRKIMAARITLAAQKGCDAIDPDNIDGYNNDNGFGLTKADAIDYFSYLATTAASLNVGIGVKNALEILPTVAPLAQFAVNEECAQFGECAKYNDFLVSKPVFHIEYVDSIQGVSKRSASQKRALAIASDLQQHCLHPGASGDMSTIIKTWDLSGVIQFCDGTIDTTQTSKTK